MASVAPLAIRAVASACPRPGSLLARADLEGVPAAASAAGKLRLDVSTNFTAVTSPVSAVAG